MAQSQEVVSKDLVEQLKLIDGMDKIAEAEFKQAMRHVLPYLRQQIISNAPSGVTGRTKTDVSTRVSGKGFRVKGRAGYISRDAVWYPNVVEYGRKAGSRMPPPSALLSWVENKLGVPGSESMRAAFLISRAIGKQGNRPGQGFVKAAFEAGKPGVEAAFSVALNKLTERLTVQSGPETGGEA